MSGTFRLHATFGSPSFLRRDCSTIFPLLSLSTKWLVSFLFFYFFLTFPHFLGSICLLKRITLSFFIYSYPFVYIIRLSVVCPSFVYPLSCQGASRSWASCPHQSCPSLSLGSCALQWWVFESWFSTNTKLRNLFFKFNALDINFKKKFWKKRG